MPLLPLYGHTAARERLRSAVAQGTLASSLLFHGPRGVGKQQLALWLGRLLLCQNADRAPCGECQSCRLASGVQHPDLHWFFPRPRPKDSVDADDAREDMGDAIIERMQAAGIYEAPGGEEGIFISTVHALTRIAALSPAMGRRKVFVVGDADRMVAQEGTEHAANAFLKLLEEPLADTTIILTSSEPGALLPTIRSRVVSLRVPPLADDEVRAFLADPTVSSHLDMGSAARLEELVGLAGGAPGRLIGRAAWEAALGQARRILEAVSAPDRGARMRVAMSQGGFGARGRFSDTLDALTMLLHERSRAAVKHGNVAQASGAARGVAVVEETKELASGNVNPQLLTASLMRQLAALSA
jgi:DNA polymerase III subunit delta'